MQQSHNITMLGTGLIGLFYTMTLHGQRGRDRVGCVYSRSEDRARAFAQKWGIPRWSTDMAEAVNDPETDVVVIGLPNHLHEEAVRLCAEAGGDFNATRLPRGLCLCRSSSLKSSRFQFIGIAAISPC